MLWAAPLLGLVLWAAPRGVRIARSVWILERVDAGSLWNFEDKDGETSELRTGDVISE